MVYMMKKESIRLGAQVADCTGRGLGCVTGVRVNGDVTILEIVQKRTVRVETSLNDIDEIMDTMLGKMYYRINSYMK